MSTDQPQESELPQVINLSNVSVETVEAELVRTNQTLIQELTAEEVELNISAVGTAHGGHLQVRDSFVGAVVSQQATLQDSLVGGVRATSMSFNGLTALALADSMSIEDVDAVVVAGSQISAENIRTGILFSREVHGNVTTLVDGRTALLAGLAGGAVSGLMLLAGKLLFGRKKK